MRRNAGFPVSFRRYGSFRLFAAPCLFWLLGCASQSSQSAPVVVLPDRTTASVDGNGVVGLTATVENDSISAGGIRCSLSGPGTINSLVSVNPPKPVLNCFYGAPSAVAAPFDATVTLTSVADPTSIATVTIHVFPTVVLPEFSPLPMPALGRPFSYTLLGSGGQTALTYAVTSGSLPPGLALSASGTMSGTATQTGTFTYTVVAQDRLPDGTVAGSATQTFTFTVS